MEEATQSQSLFLSSSTQQYIKTDSNNRVLDYNCNERKDGSTHFIDTNSCCMPVLLLDEGNTVMFSVTTCFHILILILYALLLSVHI